MCSAWQIMMACKQEHSVASCHPAISILMFILWIAGVGVCTFDAPFKSACGGGIISGLSGTACSSANGYFACWICFGASYMYLMHAVPQVKALADAHKGNDLILYLLLASITLMAQVITDVGEAEWTGIYIWALCCSIFSTLGAILLLLQAVRNYAKYINGVLGLMWFVAVATLTFLYKDRSWSGKYAAAGNGFFAIWISFFIAFVSAYASWVEGTAEAHLQDPNVYIATLLVSSFYEMWSAGTICDAIGSDNCKDELAWALAAGVISTFICLVMTLCLLCGKNIRDAHPAVAILMALLWTAGVAVITFKAPFTNACVTMQGSSYVGSSANGYFATWISFAAAWRYATLVIPQLQQQNITPNDGLLSSLLVASFVLLAQAAWTGSDQDFKGNTGGTYIWAVCVGAISFFLGLLMLVQSLRQHMKGISMFLAIWWFVATATLTFTYKDSTSLGIFAAAMNGFFAAFSLMYIVWLGQGHAATDGGGSAPAKDGQPTAVAGTVMV